jgi:hypothetical protein
VNFQTQQTQRSGDDAGRAPLFERKLGVRVQVAPQHDKVRNQVIDCVCAHRRTPSTARRHRPEVLLRHVDHALQSDAAA